MTFAMFAQHRPPVDFIAPVLGLAIASVAGMGGGEAETADWSRMLERALVMAASSFFRVVVVALPFFFLHGPPALLASLLMALGLARCRDR